MAWAEAWGAALPMAPTWVLASVAAWQSAMPMLLQWGWQLAWRSLSELQSGVGVGVPPAYRGKNIDPTPTIDVVWRAGSAALSRSDVDGRVIQGIAARDNLVSQAGNSRP